MISMINYLFAILSIVTGFLLIVLQLKHNLPIRKSYDGVICDIDEASKTVVVQYEKKGERFKATFCFGNLFSDSIFGDYFHYYIGMEVKILGDDKTKILVIPKSKNEKRKTSRGILWFGLFAFGFGLLEFISLIFNL